MIGELPALLLAAAGEVPERTLWSYRYWALSIVMALFLAAVAARFWNRALVRRVAERGREMEEALARGETLMKTLSAAQERFQAFMNLSTEGIARAEVNPPLSVHLSEADQAFHILESTRLAECNRAFALMLRRADPAELAGTRLSEIVPKNELDHGVSAFIRGGYRLVNIETPRRRRDGGVRWGSSNVVGVVEAGFLKAIWLTQRDVTEMKLIEADLRARGRVLEAVAFASARLLAPGNWEENVSEAMARLGEAVGAGCAYLSQNEPLPDGGLLCRLKHEWATADAKRLSDNSELREFIWPAEGPVRLLLEREEAVPVLVRDLPPQGRELLGGLGLRSLLIVPIFVEKRWWGLLGFGDFHTDRVWSEAEIEATRTAGIAIGAALLREQVEGAVHASERKHRDIVAHAPAGIYQATREGTLVMANLEFARLLGYARSEDVIGLNLARDVYLDPEERERIISEHVAAGQSARLEVRLVRRDGTPFWAEMSGHAIKDASDKVLLFEGFIQDITARKAAEAERERFGVALERAAEEWHRTFDAVDVAILVLDWAGRLTRINRHALSLLGPGFDDVLGNTVRELDDREPWRSASRMVEAVVQTRERATTRAVDASAGRTWELTAYLAQAGKGGDERIILMVRDISRLVELQESLRHSETMSAMGSLVAGVAHEVRNPLFSISATVDALESELGKEKEYAELTGLLRSQVNRLRQLMRDLLDYGKPPVLRLASVHPREVLRRAMRACAALAREREVSLVDAVQEDMPAIQVDGSRLEQVFQNLLANAIQHSQRGAEVRAVARVRPDDRSPEFLIEDRGTGIAPEELPRLFEPFFSRRKGGTGLGLSVVQRIVEAHGGRVSGANREGGGAVFTVRLPANVIGRSEEAHG